MGSISPSSLSIWQMCRLRWWYEYVLSIPRPEESSVDLARGTAGHAALEAYWGAPPSDRSLDLLLDNAAASLRDYTLDAGDAELAQSEVMAALRTFWRVRGAQEDVPKIPTEVRIEIPILGLWELHTVLDAVWERAGDVIIFEHKFPKSSPYVDTYLWWNMQHRLGAAALRVKKPVYVRYTLCSPKLTVVPPDLLILPVTQEEALAVAQEMAEEAQTYTISRPPLPSYGFHCNRCVMKSRCLARITGGDEE